MIFSSLSSLQEGRGGGRKFVLCLVALVLFSTCRSVPEGGLFIAPEDEAELYEAEEFLTPEEEAEPEPEEPLEYSGEMNRFALNEIWGYVMEGKEEEMGSYLPLSDLAYFGVEVDPYGKLSDPPNRRKLPAFQGRLHLVAACNGKSLTHFVLQPKSIVREKLIRDLAAAAHAYDGLQIDFENVPLRDRDVFLSFLRELKSRLGDKMLSIALPARTKILTETAYPYSAIAALVDRVLVMAYDEHWSTSEPGPIASMDWCRRVAAYALSVIGREKLIMGLPFYGRTWGDTNPNRAFYYSGIERIKGEQGVTRVDRADGIPFFVYETPLTVTVYYEDARSLTSRLAMYRGMGVGAVGFWCLGQETPAIWPLLRVGE